MPPNISHQPARILYGDGARLPLEAALVDVVVTDLPYFDSIGYADLSDFLYIWLKRGLGDIFPEVLTTPQTPKSEEAVAHKHRHHGDMEKGKEHFQRKLAVCFAEVKRVCKPGGISAIMCAHQSIEAWTALIKAFFESGLTVTATYPIDTELKNRRVALDESALESSITVICRPREVGAATSFRDLGEKRGRDYRIEKLAQGLATAMLLGSFSGQWERAGYSTKGLKLCVGRPNLNWGYTDGALLALEDRAFYLHPASAGNLGKRYWFGATPTLTKLIVQHRNQGKRKRWFTMYSP